MRKNNPNRIRQSTSDTVFDVINGMILFVVFLAFVYPVWFVLIASVSDPEAVTMGKVVLWPVGFDTAGYRRIINNADVWTGYGNTIFYTIFGTIIYIVVNMMAGYAMSRRDLPGRGFFMTMMIITMYFAGGQIPSYLNVKEFGLLDTRALMLIMGVVGVTNVIICRTFFTNSIPWELQEAGQLDGATDFQLFRRIVLPLAKPIMAVLAITRAVGHWNNYFTAMIYLKDRAKYPLQVFLREILLKSQMSGMVGGADDPDSAIAMMIEQNIANQMKYALIVVATVPILAAYPWVEKYFAKGFMIGSVKG